MKIKIVGFKVGKSRPTANRSVKMPTPDEPNYPGQTAFDATKERLGTLIFDILLDSDFISIRRVDE